jgi:glycerol-3-phosphate acyltransferase PlsX
MTGTIENSESAGKRIIVSIDTMGGDRGPAAVVAGCSRYAKKNPDVAFLLHGPVEVLTKLVGRKKNLQDRTKIRHADGVVNMTDKPSQVMRNGKGTSMWNAIDAVKTGDAHVCVSCGNTGALMALSMLRLRKLPGINRPAIAVLWPSRNPSGANVMLDVGADLRADENDLVQYALMGASYVRNGFEIKHPRIGLLNVGTEDNKGRPELQAAHKLMSVNAEVSNFEYIGFVEGNDIPSDKVDVIVTDGFTGNIALKSAEGTAKLIRELLKEAFNHTPLSKLAALLAYTSLRRLSSRIDPRAMNGGVFLGLNGTVVKSHGSADATSVASALKLAYQLGQSGFDEKLAARVASAAALNQIDA